MQEGDVIDGRYRVEKKLGQGGMGQVFRGHDLQNDKVVAIKVLFPNTPDQVIKRFHTEAKALGALNHPNIMTVEHFGQAKDGQLYLVMGFIKGDSLSSLIEKRGAQTFFDVLPIFEKICRGLRYAHMNHVLHRDIKPSNVMLANERNKEDSVKLVDFGLAKQNDKDQDLTKTGAAMGSPPYMSPEAVHGKESDERSDIYSLGCTFYEMIAGKPPFVGDTPFHTMMAHINRLPPSLAETTGKNFDEEVEEFIQKCLKKSPDARFQSMDELIKDLERVKNTLLEKKHASDGLLASGVYASGAFIAEQKLAADEWLKKNIKLVVVTGTVVLVGVVAFALMNVSRDDHVDIDAPDPMASKTVAPKDRKILNDAIMEGKGNYRTGVTIIDDKTSKNSKCCLLFGEMSDDELMENIKPYLKMNVYQLENATISEKATKYVLGLGIEKLNLYNMKITDKLMDEIGKMKRLKHLQIMKCGDLPAGSLERLKPLPMLQALDVQTGLHYPNVGAAVSGPKTLTMITLHESSLNRTDISTIVDRLPIFMLVCQNCEFTPDALTDLKKAWFCRGLEFKEMVISRSNLEQIAEVPHVASLSLHRTGMTDDMMKILYKRKSLHQLDLTRNDISESAVDGLKAALPKLEWIKLNSGMVVVRPSSQ